MTRNPIKREGKVYTFQTGLTNNDGTATES